MKKALSLPLQPAAAAPPSAIVWRVFLAGELLFSLALQVNGAFPRLAVRALQLFLRF